MKNWCPLSLMNVDHKIFSEVLADRMQVVLGSIIHKDQSGFLKGRYIGENLMELLSMIEYCNKEEIDAIIISFDFEKAFDRVEWRILDQVLKFFNFGENFWDWVKLTHSGMHSAILNYGYTSEWFDLTRSLRQGNPSSPYEFLLVIKILALKLLKNDKIKRMALTINNKLLGRFADDILTGIHFDQESMDETMDTFEAFSIYSGMRINPEKNTGVTFG